MARVILSRLELQAKRRPRLVHCLRSCCQPRHHSPDNVNLKREQHLLRRLLPRDLRKWIVLGEKGKPALAIVLSHRIP